MVLNEAFYGVPVPAMHVKAGIMNLSLCSLLGLSLPGRRLPSQMVSYRHRTFTSDLVLASPDSFKGTVLQFFLLQRNGPWPILS